MPPIQITSSSSFEYASLMRKAFDEAKYEDAEKIRKIGITCAGKPGTFYAISKAWMTSFLAFTEHEYEQPGMILNNHLIARIVTIDAIPVDDEPSNMEDYIYVDDDLKGVTVVKTLSNLEKFPLTEGLKAGIDFILVGDAVWTLLSSKFGYDHLLSFEARFLTSAEKKQWFYKGADMSDIIVEVYPWDQKTESIGDSLVPIPISGHFNYSTSEGTALTRLITDYTDADDVVPFEKTEVSSNDDESSPVLLLPPSTTGQTINEEISLKHGELESFSALRKRKRYGAGLGNLGNTCFMNATLQCLAHTWPLRQYFLSGQYKKDLNRENPLGTGGELAIEFAKLLQEMWGLSGDRHSERNTLSPYSSSYKWWNSQSTSASHSNHSTVVYPSSFKHALGKHAEQFMGYDQHDSQELATFLLDALHEDTNRVTKKPYIEKPEQGELESDDEAAAKAWSLHLKRENSRVLDDFMGQVKSRVECPRPGCGRVSTTFDPFMYLSVPIPEASTRTISFVYVSLNPLFSAKELHVVLGKTAKIAQLRQAIVTLMNTLDVENPVKSEDIIVTEVFYNEVYTFFSDESDITTIRDSDKLYVYRVVPRSMLIDDSPVTLSKPPHLPLDEAVMNELNIDDKWRSTLESYVRQPNLLIHLFHRRSTLSERVEFLESVRSLLERCFSSPECVVYRQSWEKNDNSDVISRVDGSNPASFMKPSIYETDASDAPSIEERCCNSKTFKNIRTAVDVATLEFCSRKFYQLCKEIDAPGEIQVTFSKPYSLSSTTFRNDDTFGFPLVLRISSSLTVYGLRMILADRISVYMKQKTCDDGKNVDAMQDDDLHSLNENDPDYLRKLEDSSDSLNALDIMRQVHLQYGRHRASNYYRTLGTAFSSDEKYLPTSQRLASSEDEAEQSYVLDIVGHHGKVQVFFPAHIFHKNIRLMFKVESGRSIQDNDKDDNSTTVVQCIKKYCQKEKLEETDMWYCDRCKEHVPAWKQIGLYRLPPILIVHLKRFQFSATTHRRSKIETPIDFPLVGLDLREEAKHWNLGEEPIYDCYALTNHFGGLGGGHYTAFAQNDDGEWCGFDDSRVTMGLSSNSIVTPAAYVLYYKRRDVLLPVESVLIENPPLVMDVDDDKFLSNEVSMDKSNPSGEIAQPYTSPLENDPADDRDDSYLDMSN